MSQRPLNRPNLYAVYLTYLRYLPRFPYICSRLPWQTQVAVDERFVGVFLWAVEKPFIWHS